ncbi:MAG: DUF7144 family membrane protein [Gaiellaceae bacterium]
MTQYDSTRSPEPVSGWAVGGIAFAGVILVLIGFFQLISGLAAIFEDDFYVVAPNYTYEVDVTAWGWIHFILGIVILLAGFSVFAGKTWARVVGVTVALLAAIANFFFIPYYPFWSIVIIALAVWVIWSLTRPLGAAR